MASLPDSSDAPVSEIRRRATARDESRRTAAVNAVDAVRNNAPQRRASVLRGRPVAFGVLLLFVIVMGVGLWLVSAERRALLNMPTEERVVLYRETLRHTQAICGQAATQPWLLGRCRASAEFLRSFPECITECMTFTAPYTRQPTR